MHFFWINLDEREDRQTEMKEEMKKFPDFCKFERISAIKHTPGAIGCSLSHIKALEEAIKMDLSYVCIVEDDMELLNSSNSIEQINTIKEYIHTNKDWNVIILGANAQNNTYKRKNDNFIIAKNMQTTVGYIVNKTYYNTLLANLKEGVSNLMINFAHWHFALDVYWKRLQEKDEWLCAYPYLIKQRASYSSIENHFINYDEHYMKPLNVVD